MVSDAFGYWFAGFADGEGSFCIQARNNTYQCQFQIQLRADDLKILEEIRDVLRIGNIYGPIRCNDVGNRKPAYCFHVRAIQGCQYLCDVFSQFPLRAKKANDFVIWREAVGYMTAIERLWSPQNRIDMARYKEKLEAVRRYQDPALED